VPLATPRAAIIGVESSSADKDKSRTNTVVEDKNMRSAASEKTRCVTIPHRRQVET
jgi:hypothetical protein